MKKLLVLVFVAISTLGFSKAKISKQTIQLQSIVNGLDSLKPIFAFKDSVRIAREKKEREFIESYSNLTYSIFLKAKNSQVSGKTTTLASEYSLADIQQLQEQAELLLQKSASKKLSKADMQAVAGIQDSFENIQRVVSGTKTNWNF